MKNPSEIPTEVSVTSVPDPERYELVKPSEAARREGVTEKTIYNRIHAGLYSVEETPHGKRVWIRRDKPAVSMTHREPPAERLPGEQPIPQPSISEPTTPLSDPSVMQADPMAGVQQLIQKVLQLTETISERDATISVLNNQLSTVQNKLIHIRQDKLDDKELLIQNLQQQLQELQNLRKKTSWWKFWA